MGRRLLLPDGEPLILQGIRLALNGFSPLTEVHAAEAVAWHPGALPLFEAYRPDMAHLQAVGKQDQFPFWMDRQASLGPLDEVVE